MSKQRRRTKQSPQGELKLDLGRPLKAPLVKAEKKVPPSERMKQAQLITRWILDFYNMREKPKLKWFVEKIAKYLRQELLEFYRKGYRFQNFTEEHFWGHPDTCMRILQFGDEREDIELRNFLEADRNALKEKMKARKKPPPQQLDFFDEK